MSPSQRSSFKKDGSPPHHCLVSNIGGSRVQNQYVLLEPFFIVFQAPRGQ